MIERNIRLFGCLFLFFSLSENALGKATEISGVRNTGVIQTPAEYKNFLSALKLNSPKQSDRYKGAVTVQCRTFLEQGFINGGQIDSLPNGYGSIQSAEKIVAGDDSDDSELILVFKKNSAAYNSIKNDCINNKKKTIVLSFYGNSRVAPAYNFVYEGSN